MKLAGYLFAFYLLLLSGIPCDATDNCCMGDETAMSIHVKDTCDEEDRESCPCSPLFACGASSGAIIPSQRILPEKPICQSSVQQFPYHSQALADHIPFIWQPPRIS